MTRHLGDVIRWARVKSFERIQARAGIDVDRSGILILTTLHRGGPMRLSGLAQQIGLDRSTISRQVSAVVRGGYVQRTDDAADGRAALLQLTARGQAAHRRLAQAWDSIVQELLADWPDDDRDQLARLLGRLSHQMRASPA